MTVEVLGTVLGTAIQGQIVGMANAPCVPGPGEILANSSNSSLGFNGTNHVISLEHTVRNVTIQFVDAQSGKFCLTSVFCFYFLPTESRLHDRLRCHLLNLRPLRHCAVLWRAGAKRSCPCTVFEIMKRICRFFVFFSSFSKFSNSEVTLSLSLFT